MSLCFRLVCTYMIYLCIVVAQVTHVRYSSSVKICIDACERHNPCQNQWYERRDLSCIRETSASDKQQYICLGLVRYETTSDTKHGQMKTKSKKECPPSFVRYQQTCYYFSNKGMKWSSAKEACERIGADLVKVEDQEEDNFIVSQIKDLPVTEGLCGYWTGGHIAESVYIWTDGEPLNYTRWAPGEPDHIHDDLYIAIIHPKYYYTNFQWGTHMNGCGMICEVPIVC